MFAGCPVTSLGFCNAIGLTTDKQSSAAMGETMRSFVCAAVMLASAALPAFAQTAPAPAVLQGPLSQAALDRVATQQRGFAGEAR